MLMSQKNLRNFTTAESIKAPQKIKESSDVSMGFQAVADFFS